MFTNLKEVNNLGRPRISIILHMFRCLIIFPLVVLFCLNLKINQSMFLFSIVSLNFQLIPLFFCNSSDENRSIHFIIAFPYFIAFIKSHLFQEAFTLLDFDGTQRAFYIRQQLIQVHFFSFNGNWELNKCEFLPPKTFGRRRKK